MLVFERIPFSFYTEKFEKRGKISFVCLSQFRGDPILVYFCYIETNLKTDFRQG